MARPNKVEVVTLALADAGGRTDSIDTEDVAVAAHKLAPEAFSWRKYPDQINLDSVRVTLFDACKEKYGARVEGSLRNGWNLTKVGVNWLETDAPSVRAALGHAQPEIRGSARSETRHAASEAARIRRTDAYRHWRAGRDVTPRMAAAVFRIDAYTTSRDRTLKTNRLLEAVGDEMTGEDAIFLNKMAELADDYVGPQTTEGQQ